MVFFNSNNFFSNLLIIILIIMKIIILNMSDPNSYSFKFYPSNQIYSFSLIVIIYFLKFNNDNNNNNNKTHVSWVLHPCQTQVTQVCWCQI
jgi:hypothetical protein